MADASAPPISEPVSKSISEPIPEPDFGAFLALDWADQRHAFALEDAASGRRESGFIEHTPEAVRAWAAELITRFRQAPIAVCLEQSRGPLLSMLLEFKPLVIYPAPPQAVAKIRQAFYPAGSKDDPRDALLLLDIVRHQRHRLRRLEPDTTEIRMLRLLVEDRRGLVDDKTAQKNRLRDRLKQFYPQLLQWFDELDTPLALDFLERWPTLDQAQRARPAALRRFFEKHGCHNHERNQRRIVGIRRAVPLTEDAALCEPGRAMVLTLVGLIRLLRAKVVELEKQIEELTAAHEDFVLFQGLPGAGKALAPRLLAAFGSRRDRFEDAEEVASYSGIAPLRKQSGKQERVQVRWGCPKFLRQTFHEFAAFSVRHSSWSKAYYEQQREKGKEHHAAVRSLAFKWIRILYRCWQDSKAYQEQSYLEALKRRGSPLPARLETVAD